MIVHPQDPALISSALDLLHILDWSLATRRFFDLDLSMERDPSPTSDEPPEQNTLDRLLTTHDKKHLLIQTSSSKSKAKSLSYLETSKLTPTPTITSPTTQEPKPDTPIPTLTSTPLSNKDPTSQLSTTLTLLPRDNLIFLSRTIEICSCRLSFRPPTTTPTPARPAAPLHATTSPTTNTPSALPYRTTPSSSSSQRPPLKNHNTITGTSTTRPSIALGGPMGTSNVKPLFPLPGDWISRECLALCVVWARERSLLCPRNGEVGVVRCGGLV